MNDLPVVYGLFMLFIFLGGYFTGYYTKEKEYRDKSR